MKLEYNHNEIHNFLKKYFDINEKEFKFILLTRDLNIPLSKEYIEEMSERGEEIFIKALDEDEAGMKMAKLYGKDESKLWYISFL